jgi:hypothetical protein
MVNYCDELYDTWSLALTEEYQLKVFGNRVLRRILGTKRDEVTRGWRKLYHRMCFTVCTVNQILMMKSKGMRRAGHVRGMGRRKIRTKI